jgi:hypothetical protein
VSRWKVFRVLLMFTGLTLRMAIRSLSDPDTAFSLYVSMCKEIGEAKE